MRSKPILIAVAAIAINAASCALVGQTKTAPIVVSGGSGPPLLLPRADHATDEQIREYLSLSGAADDFRESWIAAVDKNRSIGAPYWPESFWVDLKSEMRKTDLAPMFLALYEHYVDQTTMQEVIDAYRSLGKDKFIGSPMCFKLGEIGQSMQQDWDQWKQFNTFKVVGEVYDIYKPQFKTAREKYMKDHPDWKEK